MPMGCVRWGVLVTPPFPHSTFQNNKQGCGQNVLGWFRDRAWTIYEFGDVAWISSTILSNFIHVWQRKLLVKKTVHLSLTFPRSGSLMSQSVQFSCSVMSDCLGSHGLQHDRPPCPSQIPGVCSNSRPLSWWWHPTISSSVIPFSSCFQSFPASVSFPKSQLFASGGQSIGAPASVLPMNIQGWRFPLGLTAVPIPCSPRDSQESSPTPQFKSISSSALSLLYGPTLTSLHDCWKSHSFDYMELFQQSDICFLIH